MFLESEYFINNQFPYIDMMEQVSDKSYSCFEEFCLEFEEKVISLFDEFSLECQRYPEQVTHFHVDFEKVPTLIYKNIQKQEPEYFLLGEISSTYPKSHREKPSGFIFNDYSYLQIELVLGQRLSDMTIHLLYYSFHYGRMGEEKEDYHFRYDKESNYVFKDGEVTELGFKPMYHLHGNSDDPHFPDMNQGLIKKLTNVVQIISLNLGRLRKKYGECFFDPN